MNWIPLRVIASPVSIVLLVMSVLTLVRGHNEPGGGFIGGLLAASGFLVHALAFGPARGRRLLTVPPPVLLGLGILTVTVSGLFGLLQGQAFLTGQWWFEVPGLGKLSSVLIFDLGVYIVVCAAALQLLLWLLDAPSVDSDKEGEPS
ncbi:MAG: MnhB domain-containing protein [Myxococcota bacterium]|nr:MnhB domain-containing protein [Myxococcota bacterium]